MNIYDTVKTHILFISSFIWKKNVCTEIFNTLLGKELYLVT